jgi:outer membrane receptor for ferrienterochelin and colicin
MRGGFYAQVDHAINEKLSVYGGAQWNKETGSAGHTSPRLGIIYQYNEAEGIKLLYNEAFRSPTAVEADMNVTLSGLGTIFVGNSNLSPETVKTWDLQWFHYGKQAEYTLTAFHSQYADRIENQPIVVAFTPGPVVIAPGQFVQNEDLTTYGLEGVGKFNITEQDHIDSNLVWQRSEMSGGYESNSLMPCWTATLGYSHIFNNGVTWSVLNQHVSAFYDNDSDPIAPNPDSSSYDLLSSQIVVPLPIKFNKEQSAQLFVRATNLLDETVWQPNLTTDSDNTTPVEDGRAVYVGVKAKW